MKRHFAAASGAASDYQFEEVMKEYGTGVVSQVGREVRHAAGRALRLLWLITAELGCDEVHVAECAKKQSFLCGVRVRATWAPYRPLRAEQGMSCEFCRRATIGVSRTARASS